MRLRILLSLSLLALMAVIPAQATVLSSLHGVVHDPRHFPIQHAEVTLHAADSAFELQATTNAEGAFDLPQVPLGIYRVHIAAPGFAPLDQVLPIQSGTRPVLHFALSIETAKTSVTVTAQQTQTDSATPTTVVTRAEIEQTPGADRTTSMQMITDYVPGAYMTHDMLHMRGGHQTTWLIDGIAIPNTKIASNVGPQIDPKDIEQLETQRGSYTADLGDRTYGIFNVLPRSGFERNREGELLLSAGNFYTGEAQLSLGDHTAKTAWYTSLTGSRSNYGLAPPIATPLHDATNSQSAFLSVLRNHTAKDQMRMTAQFRQDYFQVPYDPDTTDWEQGSGYYVSSGLRDGQTERDSFVLANWVHTLSPRALFEVAPFYHFNQANYDASAADTPAATTWHQRSNYAGAQADLRADLGRNSLSAGLYSFCQAEDDLFGLVVNDGSAPSVPNTAASTSAGLVEFHLSDHLRVNQWITLLGGMRFSMYHGGSYESAAYPRLGATVEIPRLHWVFRGFYGHFFQPAPVETVSSAFLNYVTHQQGENAFTHLPSERDEEHQFGVQIPVRLPGGSWMIDVANVKNRVNNFLDHSNVGESNLYFPIAVDGALVRAWELTLRSPQLARLGSFHLAYSNQVAEQRGNVIGGFTCSIPTDPACDLGPAYTPVDHDQRHTLNTGFTANLPTHLWSGHLSRIWFSTNVYYGSGFTNGLAGAGTGPYDANYLPAHTTFDVSAGKSFGENWKLSANVMNVTNHRILLDNSITIGGFHFNDPRMVSAQLKYRFHF